MTAWDPRGAPRGNLRLFGVASAGSRGLHRGGDVTDGCFTRATSDDAEDKQVGIEASMQAATLQANSLTCVDKKQLQLCWQNEYSNISGATLWAENWKYHPSFGWNLRGRRTSVVCQFPGTFSSMCNCANCLSVSVCSCTPLRRNRLDIST